MKRLPLLGGIFVHGSNFDNRGLNSPPASPHGSSDKVIGLEVDNYAGHYEPWAESNAMEPSNSG